jgi:hypothetical protein
MLPFHEDRQVRSKKSIQEDRKEKPPQSAQQTRENAGFGRLGCRWAADWAADWAVGG